MSLRERIGLIIVGVILVLVLGSKAALITNENLAALVSALAWPVLAFWFCVSYRKEIVSVIDRLEQLPGGAKLFSPFGKFKGDEKLSGGDDLKPAQSGQVLEPEVGSEWGSAPANIYWLGADIFQTFDWLLRGAPRIMILRGLTQTRHHLKELSNRWPSLLSHQQRLDRLVARARGSLESDWTKQLREEFATELGVISGEVGEIIAKNQRQPNLTAPENSQ